MSRPVTVACDLFLDLKLYRLPDAWQERLLAAFPGLTLTPVAVPGRAEDAAALAAAEVYWGNRFHPDRLAAMPALRWVHFGSVGVDKARDPRVKARGLAVTNSPGMASAAMALHAVALASTLARGLHHAARLRAEKRLDRAAFDAHWDGIHDFEGQEALVAGVGEAGRRVGAALAALGMRVTGVRAGAGEPPPGFAALVPAERRREAAAKADLVVGVLPYTESTKSFFDAAFIAAMKPGALFVNVGRGETVDEPALVEALRSGRLGGAGLDVFAREPLAADSPLWGLPNAVLTPHVAGLSRGYWDREVPLFMENLKRFLAGRELLHRADPEKGS
jgi:phosphoglycerate dehydrogenase-like enzyme